MIRILSRSISPRTLTHTLVSSSLPILLGISMTADALELYVDKRTNQVYTAPGKRRVRLGTFEQVGGGEEPAQPRRRARSNMAPAEGVNARIDALEQKLEESVINAKINEEKATAAYEQTKSLPKINTKGRLEWTSHDGDFSFRLGGRLHLDAAFVDNDDGTDLVSGVDVRRARLELSGLMWRHFLWKLDYEFGQTPEVKEGFRDAYVRYIHEGPYPWYIAVGQYKEIFGGLEHRNSSNDVPITERALTSRVFHDVAEASDGRRIGVSFYMNDKKWWTGAVGVFGRNVSGDSADEETDPISFQGYATFSPIHTEGRAVHFGVGGSWMDPQIDSRVRFASRNEQRIGAQRFLDTDVIEGADAVWRYAAEFGAIYGPAWLQSEYMRTDVEREGGRPDVDFDGFHIDVGYILTGEPRGYDFEKGTFVNPKPMHLVGHGGWGAWELAARYSQLRLADQDIRGGIERNFAAGLNWYPVQNFRLMFSYIKVLDISGGRAGFDGQTPGTVELRAQANW